MRPRARSAEQPAIAGPVRSCIGCGARKAQSELTRFGVDPQGSVVVDRKRRLPGRGAYLCGAGCVTAAVKRKAFGRAFRGRAGLVDPSRLGQAWEPGSGAEGEGG